VKFSIACCTRLPRCGLNCTMKIINPLIIGVSLDFWITYSPPHLRKWTRRVGHDILQKAQKSYRPAPVASTCGADKYIYMAFAALTSRKLGGAGLFPGWQRFPTEKAGVHLPSPSHVTVGGPCLFCGDWTSKDPDREAILCRSGSLLRVTAGATPPFLWVGLV
jgi:hypothetical protein